MDSETMIQYFLEIFPEYKKTYLEHLKDYGELLQHVFYSETINVPLFELLQISRNVELIERYCNMIEYMWRNGNDSIVNVVDVTVLERLSDDADVWQNFGKHISKSFKTQINDEWVVEKRKWLNIEFLR